MTEIAALFIVLTIVIGIIGKLSADHIVNSFTNGSAALLGGALIIGVSRAILVVLNEGHIVDPMLHQVAESIQHIPAYLSVAGMYRLPNHYPFHFSVRHRSCDADHANYGAACRLIGYYTPNCSAVFLFADGIGNMIFPTATTLMAGLAIAGIPWTKWAKWILPLVLIQYLIGLIAVITAHFIGYGPF